MGHSKANGKTPNISANSEKGDNFFLNGIIVVIAIVEGNGQANGKTCN